MGCDLHGSFFVRDTFRDCACAYVNLAESKLEQVTLSGCDLREASLSQLRLKRFVLDSCDLTRAEVFRTRLRGVDLSTNTIEALRISEDLSEIRGTRMALDQAPDVLAMLGIRLV